MEQSQGRGSPGGDFRGAAGSGGGGASLTSKLDSDSSVANWCGPAALVEELCENWLSSLERTSAPCLAALCLPAPRAGYRPVPGAKRGPAPRPETPSDIDLYGGCGTGAGASQAFDDEDTADLARELGGVLAVDGRDPRIGVAPPGAPGWGAPRAGIRKPRSARA